MRKNPCNKKPFQFAPEEIYSPMVGDIISPLVDGEPTGVEFYVETVNENDIVVARLETPYDVFTITEEDYEDYVKIN